MPEPSKFILLDIESDFALEFQYFPEQISTRGRANWEPQNTTIGTKPLYYANTEPLIISLQDVYVDYTDSNTSAGPDVDLFRYQMTELEEGGPPPALLAIWGERSIRCVLTDLSIDESMFTSDGNPTRLRMSLELMELQPDGEATDVQEGGYNEDVEPG